MAKPKTKPVGQDDAVVENPLASMIELVTRPPRPLYLATYAETGEPIGASLFDWHMALADAVRAGKYEHGSVSWTINAKDGDEYAGVKLIMGSL